MTYRAGQEYRSLHLPHYPASNFHPPISFSHNAYRIKKRQYLNWWCAETIANQLDKYRDSHFTFPSMFFFVFCLNLDYNHSVGSPCFCSVFAQCLASGTLVWLSLAGTLVTQIKNNTAFYSCYFYRDYLAVGSWILWLQMYQANNTPNPNLWSTAKLLKELQQHHWGLEKRG